MALKSAAGVPRMTPTEKRQMKRFYAGVARKEREEKELQRQRMTAKFRMPAPKSRAGQGTVNDERPITQLCTECIHDLGQGMFEELKAMHPTGTFDNLPERVPYSTVY
jgi:hypothetical protein